MPLYSCRLSFDGQVTPHDSFESILELLIRSSVAKGVDGAVEIAEEVGEHVDMHVDAAGTEAGHDRENVVRRPAGHEGAQDDGDGFQSFLGSVFGSLLLLLLFPESDTLSNFSDQMLVSSGLGQPLGLDGGRDVVLLGCVAEADPVRAVVRRAHDGSGVDLVGEADRQLFFSRLPQLILLRGRLLDQAGAAQNSVLGVVPVALVAVWSVGPGGHGPLEG